MLTIRNTAVILSLLAILALAFVIPLTYGQDGCREAISANGTVTGEWTADCTSQSDSTYYARYYSIDLAQSADVTISLTSQDANTYLLLWQGSTVTGNALEESGDDEPTSIISRTLAAGNYTIEASTYNPGRTGTFSLTVSGLPSGEQPTATPPPTPQPGTTPTPPPTSGPPTPTVPAPPPSSNLAAVIERVRPSVVKVSDERGNGTGVIFKVEGGKAYVLTNEHVVENAAQAIVRVYDDINYLGTVIGTDPQTDLAVLEIPCPGCKTLPFADSLAFHVGDPVFAMGYPYSSLQPTSHTGEERVFVPDIATVTQGTISAFRMDSLNERELVQTDAAINPGNSGGPLLSADGAILGINTYIIRHHIADGLAYAVLETTVQELLPGLLSGQYPPVIQPAQFPTPLLRDWSGPSSGHIHHDPFDGQIEFVEAGSYGFYNLEAQASFGNPYSAAEGDFSFGFQMRFDPLIRVYVKSNGTWRMMYWNGSQWDVIASGPAALFGGATGWNHLAVVPLRPVCSCLVERRTP